MLIAVHADQPVTQPPQSAIGILRHADLVIVKQIGIRPHLPIEFRTNGTKTTNLTFTKADDATKVAVGVPKRSRIADGVPHELQILSTPAHKRQLTRARHLMLSRS